jgi:acyl-CoA thioesterase
MSQGVFRYTTDDLARVTTPERLGEGRFLLRVPEGWQQGRGAFGGLVLGALARAIEASEPETERRVRSLSGEITGPVLPGEASIVVAPMRRGSGVSTWGATLTQAGEELAHATAVLGRARGTTDTYAPPPPGLTPAWSDVESIPSEALLPAFARYFEFRATGPLPFSGEGERLAEGWVRPRRAPRSLGPAELVALADAWWPSAFTTEEAPRPVGTVAFTIQLFPPVKPLDPATPLRYRARSIAAHEGYVVEMRELWTERGELVALNQQTIVWIR